MKWFARAICFSLLLAAAAPAAEKHNISLVVMAPFPDGELTRGWQRGPALIPGAIVAAREINNSTEILPDFNLQLRVADTGCSITSKVAISFLRDIYESRDQVVGIVGPGCSGAALAVSNLTSKEQVSLIHVTPSATTPLLEDPRRNTTYATISSALSYVESFKELMTHRGWNSIATLQDVERLYFRQTHEKFLEEVENVTVRYTGSLYSGRTTIIPLDALRDSQARVVMVFAGSDVAAQLLCYAYHRDMLYPNYQWIFHDRTYGQLVKNVSRFEVEGSPVNCTEDEMRTATNGSVLHQFNLVPELSNVTLPLLQKTYKEYRVDYDVELERYLKESNFQDEFTPYANSYHDAVWAMAIALHNASRSGVDLRSYTYNKINDTTEIARHLSRVNFNGVSGPIAFQEDTRSVRTVIDIKILRGGDMAEVIGTFDRSRKAGDRLCLSDETFFIADSYEERDEKVHLAVGVFTIFLTAAVIVCTLLLQLAEIVWHNYRSIKATSPNLTHLVFSGCYLFSIALLILSVQETVVFPRRLNTKLYAILCNLFGWCYIVGYSLIFGTICTKTWRVYRLFRHFRNERPGRCLSDNSLIMFVLALLCVDIVVCTVWSLVDPWVVRVVETPSAVGNPILSVRTTCTCTHMTEWVVGVALYKGGLTVLLVALSILNRRIKRKDFRHTRKINILIYGVTMLVGVGMPMYFLLNHISIYIGFSVLCSILFSTVLLSCLTLFLPPVLPVLRMKVTGKAPEKPATRSYRYWLHSRTSVSEARSKTSVKYVQRYQYNKN